MAKEMTLTSELKDIHSKMQGNDKFKTELEFIKNNVIVVLLACFIAIACFIVANVLIDIYPIISCTHDTVPDFISDFNLKLSIFNLIPFGIIASFLFTPLLYFSFECFTTKDNAYGLKQSNRALIFAIGIFLVGVFKLTYKIVLWNSYSSCFWMVTPL